MGINVYTVLNGLKDKSGTICAVAAVGGVFLTAYLSGKAALKAKEVIKPEMDKKEKAKAYAKTYATTAVSAVATSALIVGSDRIHVGKEVALAGVAAMYKDQFVALDKKLAETLGEEKYKEIKKDVVKDEMKENPYKGPAPSGREILVYEPYTKQYFRTTNEKIFAAMLSANRKLQTEWDVRLNYIIKMLGGTPKPEGDLIGWNWENEIQDYNWGYYGGPWIEMWPQVYESKYNGALCLFYQVDPETQEPEDMIYSEGTC